MLVDGGRRDFWNVDRRTIFWPPGPLPLRKASSISASLILGRGGSCAAATEEVEVKVLLENAANELVNLTVALQPLE